MEFDSAVRIPACEEGRASPPVSRPRKGMAKAGPDPNPVLLRACDADPQTGKLQSGFSSRKARFDLINLVRPLAQPAVGLLGGHIAPKRIRRSRDSRPMALDGRGPAEQAKVRSVSEWSWK